MVEKYTVTPTGCCTHPPLEGGVSGWYQMVARDALPPPVRGNVQLPPK